MHLREQGLERPQQELRNALDSIEAAQHLVSDACSALSTIKGLSDEWESICQLHDAIKEKWHTLEASKGKLLPDDPD